MRTIRRTTALVTGAALIAGLPALVIAGEEHAKEKQSEEMERAVMAGDILEAMVEGEDAEIPEYLLERAYAVAVIPNLVKGAVVVGGRYGQGVVSERSKDGTWSAPLFVELGGASYGLQLGVQSTDLILVFTEEDGFRALLNDKLKLGGDVSVAAGPLGRSAEAGTNVTLDSAIYAYSRSKGVFAGVSLDGALLMVDDSANEAAYGMKISAERILDDAEVTVPADALPFHKALVEYVPPLAS